MTPDHSILVTAVGGDVGQGIVKALRLSALPYRILGCDSGPHWFGQAFVDQYFSLPPASSPTEYLRALSTRCRSTPIDAIIPGSELETELLAKVSVRNTPVGLPPIVLPTPTLVPVFLDKLLTFRFLQKKNVCLKDYCDADCDTLVAHFLKTHSFPVVVKGRRSHGSKEFWKVYSEDSLAMIRGRYSRLVLQEHIDISEEYSVGVLCMDSDFFGIAFRRQMDRFGGATSYAETVFDDAIMVCAREIALAAGMEGAYNIQLARDTQGGIHLLEVNPRFSALVAARALAGFQDADWALRATLGETLPAHLLNVQHRQLRFKRYLNEVVDLGDGYHAITEWSPTSKSARFSSDT
jgi:carbamoyl-phosphate synthase large subunit